MLRTFQMPLVFPANLNFPRNMIIIEPEILVLIDGRATKAMASLRRLAAHLHKGWMQMKFPTKILFSSPI